MGELYGGSMFIASAANDTLQGKAIHNINEKWGADFRSWNGRETIGIPVCKKKYAPFDFKTETLENGQIKVRITRMYGCVLHSHLREQVIRRVGPRKGWEPFGQWSMKKAAIAAKKAVDEINQERRLTNTSSSFASPPSSSSIKHNNSFSLSDEEEFTNVASNWKHLCQNGKCAWKVRDKYDDIYEEIREADGAK